MNVATSKGVEFERRFVSFAVQILHLSERLLTWDTTGAAFVDKSFDQRDQLDLRATYRNRSRYRR